MPDATQESAASSAQGAAGLSSPDRTPLRLGRPGAKVLTGYGVLLTFAAVFAFFVIDIPGVFLTGTNMANITDAAAVDGLLAVGITLPLIIGDFDLSIGAGASLSGAVAIVLMSQHGWSPVMAVIAALLLAVAVGLANGGIIAGLGASSFIITLAMGSVLVGIQFLLTKQETIILGIPASFTDFGTKTIGGVELPAYITLAVTLGLAFLVAQTPVGRYVRAVGANPDAARFLGLPVVRLRIAALVTSAICAALAGIFIVAVAGNSFPNAGEPHLLPAFAAAFLGSTLFPSRQFSLIGAVISAWLLEMVATGLVELNLSSWTTYVFNGLVLIVAIVAALKGRRAA
ncbi:MAG: ABC transporter permease [Actinobacteria bacterium]|nr:ABC transporter permease [Actinomycetota bacterium]MBS1884712.1 ABC transporter permease [Actinomycetota bacterium]